MKTHDEFSDYYADLLDGRYDCVDRIVLNGYFALGQQGGGFRTNGGRSSFCRLAKVR